MDLREDLQRIFALVMADQQIKIFDEMTAADHKNWDSLTHIMLIVEVEKQFKIRFRNSEVAKLTNVGSLIKLIQKKLD